MQPIIRAIDVGYSNVKFTTGSEANGDPICRSFPSLTPLASDDQLCAGPFENVTVFASQLMVRPTRSDQTPIWR